MKTLGFVLSLVVAGTCSAADTPLLPARVSTAIQDRVDAGQYPVVVVGVVDGKRSAVYTFGKLPDGKPPTGDTLFEIGSITKTFTALLLAQAVVDKRLTLDTPLAALLPGFTVPTRNGKTITLGLIAEQHSGLPRLPTNFAPATMTDPYVDYGPDKAKAFLASYTLPRDPGASYEYSNLAVGLLGYALGVRDGGGYPNLVQRQEFAPLGMTATTAKPDESLRARFAPGHDEFGKDAGNWHFDTIAAAGGIVSNANDMLRYLQANMGVILSPLYPAMQLAQTPRVDGPGTKDRIGLVWMTHHEPDGDFIWHNGATGGYSSFVGFTTDRQHGVVILTNIQHSVDDIGMGTLNVSMPLAQTRKPVTLPTSMLDEYVGNYELRPGFVIRIFRQGNQLMSQATGQIAFPVFASAKDEVFANIGDISASFTRGNDGHVSGLVLHQHGDHPAKRITDAEADATQGTKTITLDAKTLGEYVGKYQLAPNAIFDVTRQEGELYVKLATQPSLPVFASAKDKFFYRSVSAQIDFVRAADGKVEALVLHQHGADKRAPRIAN